MNGGLLSISARKPNSKGRKGLTPAARASAFPLSRWVPARRKQFKLKAGCAQSGAVRVRANRAVLEGSRGREGLASSEQPPPPAGAAGMAQASECRNSLLYYYSVKFALSTYATLFSVGARVYLLSYWHGPHGASPMGLIRLSSVNISSFEVSNPCGKIRCHGCCKVSCALN